MPHPITSMKPLANVSSTYMNFWEVSMWQHCLCHTFSNTVYAAPSYSAWGGGQQRTAWRGEGTRHLRELWIDPSLAEGQCGRGYRSSNQHGVNGALPFWGYPVKLRNRLFFFCNRMMKSNNIEVFKQIAVDSWGYLFVSSVFSSPSP